MGNFLMNLGTLLTQSRSNKIIISHPINKCNLTEMLNLYICTLSEVSNLQSCVLFYVYRVFFLQ